MHSKKNRKCCLKEFKDDRRHLIVDFACFPRIKLFLLIYIPLFI